jgi:thiosulfate/3-mercaptopyruvate sulfurtransferase
MFTTLISATELAAHLGQPNWLVIDSRHDLMNPAHGRDAHARSRIPGARFVDLDTQLAGRHTGQNGRHPLPDPDTFRQLVAQLGIGPDTQVIVHDDHTGQSAGRFWWMLRWLGHAGVAVLDGGFKGWEAGGFPVDSGPVDDDAIAHADSAVQQQQQMTAGPAMPGSAGTTAQQAGAQSLMSSAPAQPPLAPTVSTQDMLANLRTHAATVVDARAGARYRGETEPLDPVAGHIPGALNRPFQENLQPDGTFKPAAVLQQEFAALLGQVPADQVIHQCGSGVSACHNILAMEHAGLNGSALYPGSWSEWCADPGRPVAIGATP